MRCFLLISMVLISGCIWEIGHIGQYDIPLPTPEEMVGWANYPKIFPGAMADDLNGNIWIGGKVHDEEGLFRYDGKIWYRILASEIGLNEPVNISDISCATDCRIYVGLREKGVAVYDGNVWKIYNKRSGLVSDSVTVVLADKTSNIWAGTVAGLMQYNGVVWDTFTVVDGLPDNYILGIEVAGDNTIMCITKKGFARFDNGKWISCSPPNSEAFEFFYEIHCDRNGIIWSNHFERSEDFLIFWKFVNMQWQKVEIDFSGYSPYEFAFDIYGNLWFSSTKGIVKYTNGTFIEYRSYNRGGYRSSEGNSGLLDQYIHDIYIDRHNNKLIGTLSGLSRCSLD